MFVYCHDQFSCENKIHNILIIDDEPFILDIFSLLSDKGFNIQVAESGEDAMDYLDQYHLILF